MPKDSDMTTTDLFEGDLDINWTQKEKAPKIVNDSGGLKDWWRCRELNPGHHGYEPCALTI